MASIVKVGKSWRAQVRRKGYKSYVKTFPVKAQAVAWADAVERQIAAGKTPDVRTLRGRYTVAEAIRDYRKLRATSRPVRDDSSEHYMLNCLDLHLGATDVSVLDTQDLVAFCQARQEEGAGPYTVNMDVSKLGTVLRLVSGVQGLNLPDVVATARPALAHLKLIGGGGRRQRRPTEDELHGVLAWLAAERGRKYRDFVEFAVLTAMRRGEICGLRWVDLDTEHKMVLVRDRKDPRKKAGNDEWVPLLNGAWELVQAQPKENGCIFPVHPQTMSKYFTQACKALGIPDLHLHDMRHEGVSRLFEQGYSIPEVALVSGHKKWDTLKRYTQLRPEELHRGPR